MAGKPGRSGRKPKAVQFARPIAAAEKRIADRLPGLIDSLFDLAEGVRVLETDLAGKSVVYQRVPDFKAASYLVDRLMGKPVQAVEGDVNHSGTVGVEISERANEFDRRLAGRLAGSRTNGHSDERPAGVESQ